MRTRHSMMSVAAGQAGWRSFGIGIIVDDVTDQRRSEGFRSAVMSQVVDGVFTQTCEGLLTYMNSAASKLLGWTESELRGKRIHDVIHFQKRNGTRLPVADCELLTEAPNHYLECSGGCPDRC